MLYYRGVWYIIIISWNYAWTHILYQSKCQSSKLKAFHIQNLSIDENLEPINAKFGEIADSHNGYRTYINFLSLVSEKSIGNMYQSQFDIMNYVKLTSKWNLQKWGSLTFSDFILELLIPAFQLVNSLIQSIVLF